ncbi:MAG: hypothetical protein WDO73_30650 [Ignavibacteriota bacterium]
MIACRPHLVERDLLCAVPRGRRNGDDRHNSLRKRHRPFERLHAAHRSTAHGEQPLDAEGTQQHGLQAHHITTVITGKDMP